MARTHAAEERVTYTVTSRSNTRNVASGVLCGRAAFVTTQLYGKRISAAVSQHVTTDEAVFSVGAATTLYNEDLTQLEGELSSGVGSCSRELRESPELAV
jgi:hypothetical protein